VVEAAGAGVVTVVVAVAGAVVVVVAAGGFCTVRSDLKEQAVRAAESAKPMIAIFMKPPGAGAARPGNVVSSERLPQTPAQP
jgi:hypothetical protein